MHLQNTKNAGFTIVEIATVVAIMGIIATIGVFSYGAWQNSIQSSAVKSDLNSAAAKMESDRTFEDGYPVAIAAVFTASEQVQLSGGKLTDTTYCLDGQSKRNASIVFYIDNEVRERGAQAGTCATRVNAAVPAVVSGFAISSSSATQATATWTAVGGATTYTLQCAIDAAFINGLVSVTITAPAATGVINGLSASSGYYCRMRAVNAVGPGQWSEIKSTATATL